MTKLGMLGIIGGAALLTAAPFRCNGRKRTWRYQLTALKHGLRGASIEGSTAGHIAAPLMHSQRLDTAMALRRPHRAERRRFAARSARGSQGHARVHLGQGRLRHPVQ